MPSEIAEIQVFVPLVAAGMILVEFLIFLSMQWSYHREEFALFRTWSIVTFFYVLLEGIVNFLGIYDRNFVLAVQLNRIQEIMITSYLFLMPLMYRFFFVLKHRRKTLHMVLVYAGAVFTVVVTVIAFIQPDLFVSVTVQSPMAGLYASSYGRGRGGTLFMVRDAWLMALVFFGLGQTLYSLFRKYLIINPLVFTVFTVTTSFFALNDISSSFTGTYLFYSMRFPGSIISITLFITMWTMSFIISFMKRSSDTEQVRERLEKSERKLFEIAYFDELSGLPNWKTFYSDLGEHLKKSGMTAVLFLAVRNFREINESYGYRVGDEILKDISSRIRKAVPLEHSMYRIGGYTYSFILRDIKGHDDAARVALRILDELAMPTHIPGNPFSLAGNIGISLAPLHTDETEKMIHYAINAQNIAVHEQIPFAFFSTSMHDHSMRKLLLVSGMQNAVKNGLFKLHYQPIISSAGIITGLEALLRWNDPDLGYVSPQEFIPLAETTGQIGTIGDQVVEMAFNDLRTLQQHHAGLTMHINVSALQLADETFCPRLCDRAGAYGLTPESVSLEITESLLMKNPDRGIASLVCFRDKGFGVALDDFGTGYSSLNYLTTLPIDKVKIDKSFITGLPGDARDTTLLLTINDLVKKLSLASIVEGVEKEEQVRCLTDMGFDLFQGFYFFRPMPIEDFLKLPRPK